MTHNKWLIQSVINEYKKVKMELERFEEEEEDEEDEGEVLKILLDEDEEEDDTEGLILTLLIPSWWRNHYVILVKIIELKNQ